MSFLGSNASILSACRRNSSIAARVLRTVSACATSGKVPHSDTRASEVVDGGIGLRHECTDDGCKVALLLCGQTECGFLRGEFDKLGLVAQCGRRDLLGVHFYRGCGFDVDGGDKGGEGNVLARVQLYAVKYSVACKQFDVLFVSEF